MVTVCSFMAIWLDLRTVTFRETGPNSYKQIIWRGRQPPSPGPLVDTIQAGMYVQQPLLSGVPIETNTINKLIDCYSHGVWFPQDRWGIVVTNHF